MRGAFRKRIDALQSSLQQSVETVTRSSIIDIAGTGVEDINPPSDIDEFHNQYKKTGIVRQNLNKFVRDVTEPGVRVKADDETTEAYFMGETEDLSPPDFAPRGGFLENCAVLAGEKHQPFEDYVKIAILHKWTRGTFLTEYLKRDVEDPESEITGFKAIRPETVSARTYDNTNILLDPDPEADANEDVDFEPTKRGEVAAYVQFDENSILGRRTGVDFGERNDVPLSQNDVLKQVLDPDIGGSDDTETGVFGVSIIESVTQEIEEYNEIKRDRAKSIKTKAYGVWDAQFNTKVHELPNEVIIQEWSDSDQDDWIDDVDSLGPGEIIGHDGSIELQKFEGEVPDVGEPLAQLVKDITSPLPAPKFTGSFADEINRDVTKEQRPEYHKLIEEERQAQESAWTTAFRLVSERHDRLDPAGLRVEIQPRQEESPIKSLDMEEIEKINTYVQAVSTAAGPTLGPTAIISEDALRELVLQLPEDASPEAVDRRLDELPEQTRQELEGMTNGSAD